MSSAKPNPYEDVQVIAILTLTIAMLRSRWRDLNRPFEWIIPPRPVEDIEPERVAELQPSLIDVLVEHPDFEAAVKRHGFVRSNG